DPRRHRVEQLRQRALVARLEAPLERALLLLTKTFRRDHLDSHTSSERGRIQPRSCYLEDSTAEVGWRFTARLTTSVSRSRHSPVTRSSPKSTGGSWSGSSAPDDVRSSTSGVVRARSLSSFSSASVTPAMPK